MSNDLFFLLLSSGMVGLGMWMIFCPLGFYQLSKGVYTQEFLNRFETRIGSRAMGLLTTLFGLVILSSLIQSSQPEIRQRMFNALLVVFGCFWFGGLIMGIVGWASPQVKRRMESMATDKITAQQIQKEIVTGLVILAASVGWALLPLIDR